MDINITIIMLDGKSLSLTVRPQDTVGSVKSSLQSKLEVSAGRQKLVYDNGYRTPLNDDTRTLSSYNIQDGSRLSLLITQAPATIQVFLKNDKGQTKTFNIKPEETVTDFKKKVQESEGVPESQQRLIHEGREMMGGRLADYNVTELSTIFLSLRLRGG